MGRTDFSDQFRKIIIRHKRIGYRQKHNQLGIVCFTFSEKKSFSKIFHSCIKRLSDMLDI